jgi:hypothetical protein
MWAWRPALRPAPCTPQATRQRRTPSANPGRAPPTRRCMKTCKRRNQFKQVSGVKFAFDPSLPPGARVVEGSVAVSGRPLELGRRYKGEGGRGGAGACVLVCYCTCLDRCAAAKPGNARIPYGATAPAPRAPPAPDGPCRRLNAPQRPPTPPSVHQGVCIPGEGRLRRNHGGAGRGLWLLCTLCVSAAPPVALHLDGPLRARLRGWGARALCAPPFAPGPPWCRAAAAAAPCTPGPKPAPTAQCNRAPIRRTKRPPQPPNQATAPPPTRPPAPTARPGRPPRSRARPRPSWWTQSAASCCPPRRASTSSPWRHSTG